MSNHRLDMSGQSFGKLTAVCLLDVLTPDGSVWLFGCECGEAAVYPASAVRRGIRWRCRECYLSALRRGRAPAKSRAKPRVARPPSPAQIHPGTAGSWKAMLARVSPNNRAYAKNYSGRGIGLDHPPWREFSNFLADMGPRPDGLTLERRDNSKGYSPSNCEWATAKKQVSNTRTAHRLPVGGLSLTATEAAALVGVSVPAVCNRIKKHGLLPTAAWVSSKLEKKDED